MLSVWQVFQRFSAPRLTEVNRGALIVKLIGGILAVKVAK